MPFFTKLYHENLKYFFLKYRDVTENQIGCRIRPFGFRKFHFLKSQTTAIIFPNQRNLKSGDELFGAYRKSSLCVEFDRDVVKMTNDITGFSTIV